MGFVDISRKSKADPRVDRLIADNQALKKALSEINDKVKKPVVIEPAPCKCLCAAPVDLLPLSRRITALENKPTPERVITIKEIVTPAPEPVHVYTTTTVVERRPTLIYGVWLLAITCYEIYRGFGHVWL